jgi:TonB family protein
MKILCLSAVATALLLPWHLSALQQQNEAPKPQRLRVSQGVSEGLLTHRVEPEYPADARAEHVAGDIVLRILVDKQGKVVAAWPESRDDLPPNPALTDDPRLRAAAIKAVRQWEYRPYLLNGEPVEVETRVVVSFKLESSQPAPQAPETAAPQEPGAAAPQVKRLRIAPGVLEGMILRKVEPKYPPMARVAHIQGDVRMLVTIDKEGNVHILKVVSGHPILVQAAMDAVKEWKYKPFLLNGDPVEVEGAILVAFRM